MDLLYLAINSFSNLLSIFKSTSKKEQHLHVAVYFIDISMNPNQNV